MVGTPPQVDRLFCAYLFQEDYKSLFSFLFIFVYHFFYNKINEMNSKYMLKKIRKYTAKNTEISPISWSENWISTKFPCREIRSNFGILNVDSAKYLTFRLFQLLFCKNLRSGRSQMFVKMGVFKNFANFAGKQLCWSSCNFLKKRHQHRFFL